MKSLLKTLSRAAEAFDAEDDPSEPAYDPAHLGAALVLTLLSIGALYWMLWTLLVYEGGLFIKIGPALQVLLGRKALADFGYRDSFDPGLFAGWAGNVGALIVDVLAVAALHRLYFAARAARRKP